MRLFHRATAPEPAPSPGCAPVELYAYADDCRLSGRVLCPQADLVAELHSDEAYVVDDVVAMSNVDDRWVESRDLVLDRDEIVAVVLEAGPEAPVTGDLVTLVAAPYEISGTIDEGEARRTLDDVLAWPLPFIRLADAMISWPVDGVVVSEHHGHLLVNQARCLPQSTPCPRHVEAEPIVDHDAARRARRAASRRAKDFTGAQLAL